ncbi:hypothetical protein GGR58DRAFT_384186 [Xylaria digitata]|nr:hypothetical protein GGR58DRAFT_384186 [Xylaria digitata]
MDQETTADLASSECKPVVVVSASQISSAKRLSDVIGSFLGHHDDVFSEQFLTDTIIVQGGSGDVNRFRDLRTALAPNPVTGSWVPTTVLQLENPKRKTPDGPYLLSEGHRLS